MARERLNGVKFLKRSALFSDAAARGELGVLGACCVSTMDRGNVQGGAADTMEVARR